MIRRADTMGVFQIESRAQMSMLPRLRPRSLLRPGDRGGHRPAGPDPGQHGPSLPAPPQRRGSGDVSQRCVRGVLEKTLGRAAVPGAGDAAGGGGGRLHARRGRPASPRDGGLAAAGRDRPVPPQTDRRHAQQRLFRANMPRRCSGRFAASATTAFPSRTPPASRCWSTFRRG